MLGEEIETAPICNTAPSGKGIASLRPFLHELSLVLLLQELDLI